MRCALYHLYDWLKQTPLGRAFYVGGSFHHLGTIDISGNVLHCEHLASDGDMCFDLAAASGSFHCEVTPCAPLGVRRMAKRLAIGQRVRVTGVFTYDPDHWFFGWKKGGQHEVHPVQSITLLGDENEKTS